MNIQQFLAHHSLIANPFVEEDAQTDQVFKEYCLRETFHPAWEKIYGNPVDPSTSIVFGEKGSGKTAIRLQMFEHLLLHNSEHPSNRVFVVEYVDFNPFLDHFWETLPSRRRKPDRLLSEWKLWDHADAILSLGVTQLVDRILGQSSATADESFHVDLKSLDHHQARDLFTACCLLRPFDEGYLQRKMEPLAPQITLSYMEEALGFSDLFCCSCDCADHYFFLRDGKQAYGHSIHPGLTWRLALDFCHAPSGWPRVI